MAFDPSRNGEGDRPWAAGSAAASATVAPPLFERPPVHRSTRGGWILALLILLVDQLSKWWIAGPLALPLRESIELVPIFRLIWVENHGVSMSLLTANGEGQRWLLVAMTAAIAAVVAVWLVRARKPVEALALGAILGGAIGNIADRVRLGYVADFLNLHFGAWSPFLVFNVADAAISLGVALLVVRSLLPRREPPAPGE